MSSSFIPGQRWVSSTESELGLGIVVELANRRVEISFPAAGERRTYAIDNAPISRVRYEVGQLLETNDQLTLKVIQVMENNGCFIYQCVDADDNVAIVPEIELNSFVQFSEPQDRLFAGQVDKLKAYQLRSDTLAQLRHQQQSAVRGLLGARVQLLPHQLYIANEVSSRYAPRVLLADEVGLGKTIEAGLILHQQLITGRASRVLVIVPDSLLHQWLVEMLRKFNIFFTILDEERCQALAEVNDESELAQNDEINPFETAQTILCKLSFLSENSERYAQAMAAEWDLLIVDEAHHLAWSEEKASQEYQCIEGLAQQAKGVLLLTATPEQLGVESHFARLRLLDPDRYYDLAKFKQEEKQHESVNALVQKLLSEDLASFLQEQEFVDRLQDFIDDDSSKQLIAAAKGKQDNANLQQLLEKVKRDLLDRHGTGRVLFRNTRSSVSGFPERNLNQYPLQLPDCYQVDSEGEISHLLNPELGCLNQPIKKDSRADWLANFLKSHRDEKVLVICAQASTAIAIEEYLRLGVALQSAVFHEGLSLVARDRAAAYFSDEEEGAQVLICSEIGSEGRNFQFAHHLVLFDLPLNPDLLEQRIGRLDRIGQRHTIEIHVPYFKAHAQQVLLNWYHQGMDAFEHINAVGSALYQQFKSQLEKCMRNPADLGAQESLIDDTRNEFITLRETLQQGKDRLLELSSFDQEKAEALVNDIVMEERRQDLSDYMENVFDQFGVEQEYHSAGSYILRASDHMLYHTFPGLDNDGVTATVSRDIALSREDMEFLSWEHPMVTGAMDMVMSNDFGNTAFCTLKLAALKEGTLILETNYVVRCTAPLSLQLERYLPLTTVRVAVNHDLIDLSKVLSAEHLNKLGKKVHKRDAQEFINQARPQISHMIEKSEQLAKKEVPDIVAEAVNKMSAEQDNELSRLQNLAKVNSTIRQEEIDYLKETKQALLVYLQAAQLKLDSLRIALVVK